jgi:TPR repeat protein
MEGNEDNRLRALIGSIGALLLGMATTLAACGESSEPPPASPVADPSVYEEAEAKASRALARVDREILEDRIRELAARTGVPPALAPFWDPCLQGRMNACESIGDHYGSELAGNPDPEAAQLFYRFTRDLAEGYCDEGGDRVHGCSQLGRMYSEGLGVDRNDRRGVELRRRGCSGGDSLACMYLQNEGLGETGP